MWVRPLPPSWVYVLYTDAYRQKGFDYKLRYKIFEGTGRRKFWRRIDRMYGTNNYIYPGVKGSLSTFDVDFLRICLHSEETDGIVSCMGSRYTWLKLCIFIFREREWTKERSFLLFSDLIWFDTAMWHVSIHVSQCPFRRLWIRNNLMTNGPWHLATFPSPDVVEKGKNEDERETSLQSERAFIIQLLMQLQHLLM
jgi:hypothetical protein